MVGGWSGDRGRDSRYREREKGGVGVVFAIKNGERSGFGKHSESGVREGGGEWGSDGGGFAGRNGDRSGGGGRGGFGDREGYMAGTGFGRRNGVRTLGRVGGEQGWLGLLES